MNELGLFAGAGGGLLASAHLLGWRTVCAVEIDKHCQAVLRQRQLDGGFPDSFPVWDDVRTFDGRPWRGHIDVVSGGFPCQDISSAGRRAGLDGDRSGLWFEMQRIIGECEPAFVFAENSPCLRTRGLDRVLEGLAGMGFDACWGVLGAWHVGAPHKRNRMWIVAAHPDRCRERGFTVDAEVAGASGAAVDDAADADRERQERRSPAWRGQSGERRWQTPDSGHAADANYSRGLQEQGIRTPLRQTIGIDARDDTERGVARGDWWSVHRFAGVDDGVASALVQYRAAVDGEDA